MLARRVSEVISQRELRNDGGRIMRALDEGRSFVPTRNSVPEGELRPLRRQRMVDTRLVSEMSAAPHASTANCSSATSTTASIRVLSPVPERLGSGLLDTSVDINLDRIDPEQLPRKVAVSAITMAELAAGPAATLDLAERARRKDRLQRAEAAPEPIPFGSEAARAYGEGARRCDGGRAPTSQEVRGSADCLRRGRRGFAAGDPEG